MLPVTRVTFFPAEAGVPQDPVLVVIEMDFPVGREEGVGEFPGGAVEAVVDQGLQTVRVVDRVEACEKKKKIQCIEQGKPSQDTDICKLAVY